MTYADYNTCFKYCYKGICELSYNAVLNINEYTCKTKAHKFPFFWIFFIIIPIIGVIVFTLIFCCCRDKSEDDVETEPTKVVHDLNQKTKMNPNSTGLIPQYQQVTLSNGQVGILIHQSQPQIVTAQQSQQASQFYFPQQPEQQQIFQNQEEQTVQMPKMQ
ncbi:Hypothetical_protein [Hexamita inflata]|uniref:Hypothetical_protein n=1 Tax=Hexamita inflata TaxID=28002 RepID=A0AA86THM6_9EUKA|nr:Hypothetical protein HINF_LOCUS1023 [Hexamita inflata]CAI9925189.1 Hypothetical protein HINF_LOCUS12834 [Hexamita inflata]CAI9967438.1 Hypothetical protein HINF_LOCUS55083 [Hexamita inflata]CAI9973493.1 Hypothetical protein HINF_LOCUS61138 [Hexamita inflata]